MYKTKSERAMRSKKRYRFGALLRSLLHEMPAILRSLLHEMMVSSTVSLFCGIGLRRREMVSSTVSLFCGIARAFFCGIALRRREMVAFLRFLLAMLEILAILEILAMLLSHGVLMRIHSR